MAIKYGLAMRTEVKEIKKIGCCNGKLDLVFGRRKSYTLIQYFTMIALNRIDLPLNTTETIKYYKVQVPKASTFPSNQLSYFKNTHLSEIVIHNFSKFRL